MEKKMVSILMPAYNEERYIGEAITSVINQTYQNWELIIVDDCSQDRTSEIIKQYIINEPKIKLHHFPENRGACAALNEALSKAKGEYICWLSADDKYKPDMLRSSINYLHKHPKMQAVFSKHEFIHEDSGQIEDWEFPPSYLHIGKEGCREPYITLCFNNAFNACTVLAETKAFQKAGHFNLNHPYAGDYDYMMRLAAYSDIGFLNQVNVESRVHKEQVSNQGKNDIDAIHAFGDVLFNDDLRKRLFSKAGLNDVREVIIATLQQRLLGYTALNYKKEVETCKNLIQKFLTEFPHIKNADAYCRKISKCMETHNWSQAEILLFKECSPEIRDFIDKEDWSILLATYLEHIGDYQQAKEILHNILNINENNYEAEYMLGNLYELEIDKFTALKHYTASVTKSKNESDNQMLTENLKRFVIEQL